MLSGNQLKGSIKLNEIWKATTSENYPLQMLRQVQLENLNKSMHALVED